MPARADAYVVTTQLLDLSDSTLSLWEVTSASGLDVAMRTSDDDSGIGLASLAMYAPAQSATVYVRIRAYSLAQLGRFNFTIIDATAGTESVGPAPCIESAIGASCVLPLGCIKGFNDHREGCPAAGQFSCESSCAPLLVLWYASVQPYCRELLALMPEWDSFTALGTECDAAVYGRPELAILIRVGETQAGRIGRHGYQEWFKFEAIRYATRAT